MVEERAPAIPPRGVDLSGLWSLLAVSHRTLVLPAATAFAAMVAWQAVVTYGQISPAILPPPTMVLEQLVTNFWLILKHTIPTTYETLLAFGMSIPRPGGMAGARSSTMLNASSRPRCRGRSLFLGAIQRTTH